MRTLTIVQPYVPTYRVPFFEGLIEALERERIRCSVAAPVARGQQALRGDSATPSWIVPVERRELSVGKRRLVLGGSRRAWQHADAVVLGHRGSSLDNYLALFQQRQRGLRVGLWGHIKDYVTSGSRVDQALERFQMRRADHVFAYVPSGRDLAIAAGVEASRVTAVMNAVDDSSLRRELALVTEQDLELFAREHRLDGKRVFCFIGGLDESKRVTFLLEAISVMIARGIPVVVLVAGKGAQESLIEPFARSGHIVKLGYAGASMKALMLKSSEAIVMPGRVGLLAVEALLANRPILTTEWPFHAPEIEYLEEGVSVVRSPDSPEAYAGLLEEFRPNDLMRSSAIEVPTLAGMVENFTAGVIEMMSAPQKCERWR